MKRKPAAPGVRIEHVALGELQRWPRNPKGHDGAAIGASTLDGRPSPEVEGARATV